MFDIWPYDKEPDWNYVPKKDEQPARMIFEVPGVKKEDVKISITNEERNSKMTINFDKTSGFNKEKKYYSSDLPMSLDLDQVTSSLEDGILTILLPEKEPNPANNRIIKVE